MFSVIFYDVKIIIKLIVFLKFEQNILEKYRRLEKYLNHVPNSDKYRILNYIFCAFLLYILIFYNTFI